MRGKRRDNDSVHRATRITPADAGKTVTRCNDKVPISDHPRGCGENDTIAQLRQELAGSPPRMRGKPTRTKEHFTKNRITPADAGKTYCQQPGEERSKGSPPRMRGKPRLLFIHQIFKGITPADAGKTQPRDMRGTACWDHPRGCGENVRPVFSVRLVTGSPPRMRGKHVNVKGQKTPKRITPADAGKTIVFNNCKIARWDHPRGCGENSRRKQKNGTARGSPPRMRGKRSAIHPGTGRKRITPADAGKTPDIIRGDAD